MKTIKLQQIAALVLSLLLSAVAWAVPTSGTPYNTDPQNEYVQDATSDAIGSVNMVLCIMNAMNMSGSGMINVGPYVALIDINKCQAHGSTSSSTGGASGAAVAANYMTAVVDATRASGTAPMVARIWMSLTENNLSKDIFVRLSATQSPTEVPPYGVFRLDYIGMDSNPTMQFNGYIDASSSGLLFLETGPNSSNVALNMTAGSTSSGSGSMNAGVSPVIGYDFNYNSNYFRRNAQCFDRAKANADRSVWRYGTYKVSDGTRIDQANPSFPITATYSGNSYYGYAGYYGINFQGLDLNGMADASPIPLLTVTDQRPGNTTTYNLSKVGGKLTKWSRHGTTLDVMDGVPFYFSGNLVGTDNVAVSGWGNWQMQWNTSTARFSVTGTQVCGSSGCALSTLATPATVNLGAFNGMAISGWSDSFGGNINIPPPVGTDHVGGEPVNYFSQSTVIPGDPSAPTALSCLSNCPDSASVNGANGVTTGPFNTVTTTQWFSAPSANTVSYTFDAGGLQNGGITMIINTPAFFNANPMFQFGVMSGRLFDSSTADAIAPCGSGNVCEPSNPTTYYTWSTGMGQWNQSMWLTNGSSVVAFDPPQNVTYGVPNDATLYGTWANKTIQLQFNGFGNLFGIPGHCVNPVDNSVVADCSTQGVRYVPEFSIADDSVMSLGGTSIIVKALDAEIRFKNLGRVGVDTLANNACGGMTLTPQTPPSGGTHDMSSTLDAYYIGVKPTVTTAPKVIDGVVQY